jgi:hypothetical protein
VAQAQDWVFSGAILHALKTGRSLPPLSVPGQLVAECRPSKIIAGMPHTHPAGVYLATPTPTQTPKRLTQIANLDEALCGVGNVDINNAGIVVFEAKLDGEPGCSAPDVYDALYRYGSSVTAFALRSDTSAGPLGSHGDYHSVRLGQINSAQQVSFLTISTDASEPPVKVWRADIVPR